MPYFALLDDAVRDCATLYDDYVESRFLQADALHGLDGLLQQGWRRGLHVVLWADYAFGHPLQHLSPQPDASLALHWFRKCETVAEPEKWLQSRYPDHAPAGISTPTSHTGKADYLHAVGEIQAAIARGDTYQINYTTRLQLQSYGHPAQLYRRLRQPVPYAALAHLPDHKQQPGWTLSFSPELFVNIASDGLITTEPMKGTAPVLGDGGDEARAQALQADPKNRAENIMIVDLLRNDLGKIATTGGVRVPAPFQVRRFGSVWQMTTAIEAQAKPHTSAADIFRAAFPCGSITGAPKRMSMQIIDALETSPRGLYTGAIGWVEAPAPDSDRRLGDFALSVAIRTLELGAPVGPAPGQGGLRPVRLGVGGGIVLDS
ncbi:MAG TPA: anthranilate synthase component I family protein, partial [Neisseria sp.]|nr:anthranilate synthase component I family protein [Neisseria sp.]